MKKTREGIARELAREIVDTEYKLRGNSWNHYLVEEAITKALLSYSQSQAKPLVESLGLIIKVAKEAERMQTTNALRDLMNIISGAKEKLKTYEEKR